MLVWVLVLVLVLVLWMWGHGDEWGGERVFLEALDNVIAKLKVIFTCTGVPAGH